MDKTMPLKEIFDLMRRDRKAGVRAIYASYYNKMYGIAFSVVRNETLTEDVVQNVCYKLLTVKGELFPVSNESAWLYSVVKNEALTVLRKEKKTVPSNQIRETEFTDSSIDDYVNMEAFHSMIRSLNDTQRTIVTLKVLGGFTHKEIAELLNKPVGTVQWIYNTSIKKLKAVICSLFSAIFALFVAAFVEGIIYYQNLSATSDSSAGVTVFYIDYVFAVLVAVLVILIIGVIIFIKNSQKIPTKATKKSV